MAQVDHFMYGVADLDAGVEAFERLTGVRAAIGGSHAGRGTRNTLVSLGEDVYLEIIGPDPGQDLTQSFGDVLRELSEPGLITWCAADGDLTRAAEALRELELEAMGPVAMSREDPVAGSLAWELLFIGGHDLGMLVPFLIDWKESPHPAARAAQGCLLKSFELRTPETVALRGVLDVLELDVPVVSAEEPGLAVVLETLKGEVRLGLATPLPERIF